MFLPGVGVRVRGCGRSWRNAGAHRMVPPCGHGSSLLFETRPRDPVWHKWKFTCVWVGKKKKLSRHSFLILCLNNKIKTLKYWTYIYSPAGKGGPVQTVQLGQPDGAMVRMWWGMKAGCILIQTNSQETYKRWFGSRSFLLRDEVLTTQHHFVSFL